MRLLLRWIRVNWDGDLTAAGPPAVQSAVSDVAHALGIPAQAARRLVLQAPASFRRMGIVDDGSDPLTQITARFGR